MGQISWVLALREPVMLTLPADVARCRGRTWSDDEWMASECQECKRWVAHYCHEMSDGIVAHQEPPTERECPLRLPVDDSKPPNVEALRQAR